MKFWKSRFTFSNHENEHISSESELQTVLIQTGTRCIPERDWDDQIWCDWFDLIGSVLQWLCSDSICFFSVCVSPRSICLSKCTERAFSADLASALLNQNFWCLSLPFEPPFTVPLTSPCDLGHNRLPNSFILWIITQIRVHGKHTQTHKLYHNVNPYLPAQDSLFHPLCSSANAT